MSDMPPIAEWGDPDPRQAAHRAPDMVLAYYLPGDGAAQLSEMWRVDFDEARARHPNEWALAQDEAGARVPPPAGLRVVDMRQKQPDYSEVLPASMPPMVPRPPGQVEYKIRAPGISRASPRQKDFDR